MVKTIEKCTAWVLAAAILLSMACIGVYAQRAPFRYGDVNGDGKVSAADAMEVSKHTAKIITLTGDAFKAADVNGDGIVSVKDAILIQQYVAKVIDVFPVELIQPTDPTVQPTELPTTTPTEAPTIKPTDPERYDTLVNGKKANVGDEIVYTAYLYAKDLVAGVNAYVNYTGDVLKISDITLGSKKKAVLPILANGSSVLNFNPVDGSDSIYFNGANADEGYDFSAKESILVTVRFDVIKEGTASIGTSMTQILSMELDSSNKNQPLEDYTLTDKTEVIGGTVDPTEAPTQAPTDKPTEAPTAAPTDKPTAAPTDPTEAPTQKPTEAPTVAPTEVPTEKPTQVPTEQPTTPPSGDAVINGQKASIGDQVTYTAYLKADELVAGVNAHVTYTGGVLKLSQATLDSKKAQVIPVLATGSSVLNFDPVDGTNSVYFNGANSDEGYEFFAEKTVLVTLTFDVIGAGTAEIKTAIAQILSMQLDSSNKNQPLKDYTLTDETKVIKGTTDPTEPTEAPTVAPTEAPTEKPTQKPTEQPTTPSSGDAVINGQKANIGDQVTYTAYLKADELVAGVNAHVTYTGGVLKLSQATLDSKKAQVIPVLATGSSVLNFDPVDGTNSVYFNGANSDEGYEFFAEKTVLVTLTFDVIGAGTAEIKTAIAQILSMQLDSSNKNQPLKDYTLTDETKVIKGTTDPTEPTEAPTVAPTEAPTEKPTQAPTEQPTTPPSGDAVINGQKASIGDQVTYTAYLKADELVAGVNAHVTYTGGVLKLSQATLDSKKAQVIPVLATGSSVLNFDPVDGTNSVYFNGANSDEGYEFFAEKTVLVTLTFDVIGAGTAEIKTAIAQILSMQLDSSNKNQPLKDYTLTDETKVIKGTTDPTEPTEAPTVAPTEAPTEKPTQAPTEQPTTPPSGDAVINGQKASIGDQVTYTAYLKADELVAGVNAHVTYTGGVLKLSQATLDSKKAQVIPVLATGSSVLNFDPVDGTNSVYFNGANSDEGYEFFAEKTVLVTLTFDVIGAGTAEIKTAIAQILSMQLDSSNKNQPLKDYTLTDKTEVIGGTVDPTEPTEAPTQKPTEAPTVAPTEAPTEKPTQKPTEQPTTPSSGDAVINGQKANIGDQVTYTAYLKADELVAGVNAHVTYTGGVLKLSQATLDSKKAQVIPVLATGSSVLNFDPVDGTNSVYFNGANSDEGYEFFAEKTVLVTLTFDVIGAGTAEIKTAIAQILSMELDSSNKNQPLKDYTLTGETKVIKGTTDPASDAVINGVTANIGDQVTYTAYISASEAAAGIIAYVPYNDSVLKLSNETLTSKKNQVIPAFATGSSVLNFTPVDGSSAVYFNSADPDEGYDLPEGSVLVTLTFDVIGKGTAAVSPQVKQFLSMRKDADGKYLNLTDYQITSDLIKK